MRADCVRQFREAAAAEQNARAESDGLWKRALQLRRDDPDVDAAYKARSEFVARSEEERDADEARLKKQRDSIDELVASANAAMEELAHGEFCSKCKRTKTEIEKQEHVPFLEHVKEVKGEVLTAAELGDLIAERRKEYTDKIDAATKAYNTAVASAERELAAEWQRLPEFAKAIDDRERTHAETILSLEERARNGLSRAMETTARARARLQSAECTAHDDPASASVAEDEPENATRAPTKNDRVIDALLRRVKPGSQGACSKYVTDALREAGIKVTKVPSAYQLGFFLEQAGYRELPPGSYTERAFRRGDIVVFQPAGTHVHGHVAVYDGQSWLSDFLQRSLIVNDVYRTAPYSVYRRNP